MKKYIIAAMVAALVFTGCKKNTSDKATNNAESTQVPQNSTRYCKGSGVYDVLCYSDEADLGKTFKQLQTDKKAYFLLSMGNKVTVLVEKKIKDKVYSKIKLPDDSEYWIDNDFLTDRFAVVNKTDLLCYRQPEENYVISGVKLEPGDFGYIVDTKNDWVKVDFRSYRGNGEGSLSKKNWIGEVWIKDGFTEDITAAKQGYYLYLSYYYELVKNDPKTAGEMAKIAQESSNGVVTDIDQIITDRISSFTSTTTTDQSSDKAQ